MNKSISVKCPYCDESNMKNVSIETSRKQTEVARCKSCRNHFVVDVLFVPKVVVYKMSLAYETIN